MRGTVAAAEYCCEIGPVLQLGTAYFQPVQLTHLRVCCHLLGGM
jgi:hypothetical protein